MCDYDECRAEHFRQQMIARRIEQTRHIEIPLVCLRCGQELLGDRSGLSDRTAEKILELHWDVCTPDWRLQDREQELIARGIPDCVAPVLAAMIESPSSEGGRLPTAAGPPSSGKE